MKNHLHLMFFLLVAVLILATGCDSSAATSAAPTAPAEANNPAVPVTAAPAPKVTASPKTTTSPAKANSNANCAAWELAYANWAINSQLLIQLRDDAFYTNLKESGAAIQFINTTELRSYLDVLASLPDPSKAGVDKPSDMVRQFRQILDLVDSNIKSGKPFTDGSGNGQKVLDLVTPLMITQKANVAFSSAFGVACANYTPAPRPTNTPQAFKSKTKAECAILDKAVEHFMPMGLLVLVLATDEAYAIVNGPDPELRIDTAALRADLKVFATLPDIAEVMALYDGTLSQLLPPYRQALDQIDANVKAGSTPFSDGSGNGQKVLDLAQPLLAHTNLLLATSSDVCK